VQLSNFEKLKILRDQREERAEELNKLEHQIRMLQSQVAEQRYLETLSPYYSMQSTDLPSPDEVNKLEEKRSMLKELIDTIDREIPETLEKAQSSGESEPAPAQQEPAQAQPEGTAKKAKFDF
jgi:hypothetical protein